MLGSMAAERPQTAHHDDANKRSNNTIYMHATPTPLTAEKTGPLSGTISVPGDKSISHRALLFGALATGKTTISGILESTDIVATANALRAMGVPITKTDGLWEVVGRSIGGLTKPQEPLDFGNAGTGVRLMMGVLAGQDFSASLTGDASLSRRPMGRVLAPLKTMGLQILEGEGDLLPLTVQGTSDLLPIVYELPVASAQVKSAVLLAGLHAAGRTTVCETEPTRDHTERMLQFFGADLQIDEVDGVRRISVDGEPSLEGRDVKVPGDPSSAAFIAAAAVIQPGSDVTIQNVLINPTRTGFFETLKEMGADLAFENERLEAGEKVADIHVRQSALTGVAVPAERAPTMIDEYPILSVVAAFADGTTRMEGLHELRVKESDRLSATHAGLTACGVKAIIDGDTLFVEGQEAVRGGGLVETHLDHRIAMSFLTLGLQTQTPVTVDDGTMIATSFPNFLPLMAELGAKISAKGEAPS